MDDMSLPVPPPAVRPSVKHDGQQRSDDDLTHIYMNIIKYNNILTEKVSNPETSSKIIEDWTDILQHSIAMVVNNKIKGVAPWHRGQDDLCSVSWGELTTKRESGET
jgi:DNA-directed RNA polymerase II subunit RPB1